MSSKWLATVLFTMVTVSATSCTDSTSTASEYLAKNKSSAASGDQEADAGGKTDGDEDAGGAGGSDDENSDDGASDDADEDGGTVDTDEPDPMDPVKDPDPVTPTPVPDPKPVDPTPVPDPKPMDPVPAKTTYADINTKFFAKYCTQCHGTKGGVNLQTYAKVKQYLAAIKAETITTSNMPQGALQPSAAELKLLSDWIEAGGPEK